MNKFSESNRRPDDGNLPDAGYTTGADVDPGVSSATMGRGYDKVRDAEEPPPYMSVMEGGVVGRPRGWQR